MLNDKRKLRVIFIYTSFNNKFLHDGLKYDDNLFYFYGSLIKSPRIDVDIIEVPKDTRLDCSKLMPTDIIVIDSFAIPFIDNLHYYNICPKFLRAPDPYDFNHEFEDFCSINWIEHLFYSPCESSFRRIVDTPLQYHQIIHGIREPKQIDFEDRSDSILFTGCIGNLNDRFYHLRKVISNAWKNTFGMDFVKPYQLNLCGDAYRNHLACHKTSIAATRQYFSLKYLEIPAAGTLCFMEDDGKNGIREMGFIDDVNAMFINEDNFEYQFMRFESHPDAEEVEAIAKAGHDLVMSKYSNQIQVDKLIDIFYSTIN